MNLAISRDFARFHLPDDLGKMGIEGSMGFKIHIELTKLNRLPSCINDMYWINMLHLANNELNKIPIDLIMKHDLELDLGHNIGELKDAPFGFRTDTFRNYMHEDIEEDRIARDFDLNDDEQRAKYYIEIMWKACDDEIRKFY